MSIELPVTTKHRRDMTEKLLKATLNPNKQQQQPLDRRDSSSGRASASCAVGQDACRIDTWPRHTKDVIKMVPVVALLGAQHYKASTGFSSLTSHASLTSYN